MPLETIVVDSKTGQPIEGAILLRIICDIHDIGCKSARIDKGISNKSGIVKAKGKRRWGIYIPAPGGLPIPNHNIAIWKEGYEAFVFSQYGSIQDILKRTDREDLIAAINDIPRQRKVYGTSDEPNKMFLNGQIELHKIE